MKKALFALISIIIVLSLNYFLSKPFKHLEDISYDIRARLAVDGSFLSERFAPADKNIVLLAVDDYTRNVVSKNPQLRIGSWPWRRDIWVDVIDYIEPANPKAILFDIIFTDINPDLPHDKNLSNALKKYNNIVLATTLNHQKFLVDKVGKSKISNGWFLPAAKSLDVQIDDEDVENIYTYYSHSSVHDIYTKYNTMGVVNKVIYGDNVIRGAQPIFKLVKDGQVYYLPSLAFAGFMKAVGEDGKIIIKNHKLYYKDRVIPLDDAGLMPISWHGNGKDYNIVPVSDVLLKKVKPDFFKNKIVIIGRTEAGTDIHPAAVHPLYLGPEVNATVTDNLISDTNPQNLKSRKIIIRVPRYVSIVLTALFCTIIATLSIISKNALLGFINGIIVVFLYISLVVYTYIDPSIRLWIPIVTPLYYLIVTSAIVFGLRLQKEHAKKAEIMGIFGKFVSPSVLKTLLHDKKELVLENIKKHVTVMFCDVKNFTTLSETCNPEQLVENLNEMFDIIVNIIFANNGTVDKFIGDCVMAYWGDPIASEDDTVMAVKTALEVKEALKKWREENPHKLPIDVKIGINTGDALLGLVGSNKLMSYTAMGDVVNTAARLEASCRTYGRDILISKATYDEAKDYIEAEIAGTIEVKGKAVPIEIYEPKGLKECITSTVKR